MHTGKSWSLQLTFISLLLQALRNHFIAIPLFIYLFFFSVGGGRGSIVRLLVVIVRVRL